MHLQLAKIAVDVHSCSFHFICHTFRPFVKHIQSTSKMQSSPRGLLLHTCIAFPLQIWN